MDPRCAVPDGNVSRPPPLSARLKSAGFALALLAAATSLSACSAKPQSLADYIAMICSAPFRSAAPEEAPFLSENVDAMTKMMIDMGIHPSGDVDNDFVSMMIPHHQGAIEMAQAELRYGRNEQLRRLAQEIIVTQQQEIAAMRLALGQPLPPSVPSPDQLSRTEPMDANPAGSAIVNAVDPIRQVVQGEADASGRYLAIASADYLSPQTPDRGTKR